jgi:hypothetical protein
MAGWVHVVASSRPKHVVDDTVGCILDGSTAQLRWGSCGSRSEMSNVARSRSHEASVAHLGFVTAIFNWLSGGLLFIAHLLPMVQMTGPLSVQFPAPMSLAVSDLVLHASCLNSHAGADS